MDKLEKLCIKWLNKNFNPMEPFYMEEYPDYIFHMKDGKCILQHNKKNGYVYVSYREIWKFFESYFSMDNQQIKDITKIWVEEHYKVGVTTTRSISRSLIYKVEEHYKMGVTTTHWHDLKFEQMVEEHYKMEATMTNLGVRILNDKVEEHYKMGVTTTVGLFFAPIFWMEEHYKMEVTPTDAQLDIDSDMVEEQYKMGVTSIQEFGWRLQKEVDEQYNIQING